MPGRSGLLMKFSCDRCQTRYSIGDDKVKGKILKIRCKTCGNIVVVREQIPTVQGEASGYAVPQMAMGAGSGSVSTSTPSAPSAPAMAPGSKIDWYVAIKGKQHGPAKEPDIARLFHEGKISERTYLWHDALPSWIRLRDLPEFAGLVAEGPQPKRQPPPPPPEGAEIVNFEAARAQRQQQQPQAAPPGPVLNDPFAAIGMGPGGAGDAPRESTRVFIMQAGLHNRASKHKMYAGIAAAVVVGFTALCVIDYKLDILGLKRVVDAVAVSTGIRQEPVEAPGAQWDDSEVDPAIRCKLNPNPAECIKKAKAERVARRRQAKANGAAVSGSDLDGAFGAGGPRGTAGPDGPRGTVDGDGFVKLSTGGPSSDEIKAALGGKAGPSGPKARVDTPSVAGTTIDADNAGRVVRDGQAGIQICVENAMRNGEDIPSKIRMTLSVGLKGTVERAVVNNAVVQASGFGACVTGTAKKWKFAPPSEPADLEIPLYLR